MKFFTVLSSSFGLAAALTQRGKSHTRQFDPDYYNGDDVITRDVAVIGGGASGTYAAIKLGDMGKSVVLVERASLLGGQVNTYEDLDTGTKIDYGVQAYYNTSIVTDFFARFDVPLTRFTFGAPATPIYADFNTGQLIPNFTVNRLSVDYSAHLDKYPYLTMGFHLPNPVPDDLLLTWKDYIEKYSLQDQAYTTSTQLQGSGYVLESLTINVFKAINRVLLDSIGGAALRTARHDNSELFNKAQAELGQNALLNSTVIAAQRAKHSSGVRLVIQTPTGNKLIMASQLVLGIPPVLSNMRPFNLDAREMRLLQQLHGTPYYCGLVRNTGLPSGYRYVNVGADMPYNVPTLPGAYMLNPTSVEGIFLYWYGSLNTQSQAEVEADVAATIQALKISTNITAGSGEQPEFVAFGDHSPYHLVVSADAIKNGFYDRLYGLQGYRNTWYIGALFVLSSSQLWMNIQAMLPQIVAAAT